MSRSDVEMGCTEGDQTFTRKKAAPALNGHKTHPAPAFRVRAQAQSSCCMSSSGWQLINLLVEKLFNVRQFSFNPFSLLVPAQFKTEVAKPNISGQGYVKLRCLAHSRENLGAVLLLVKNRQPSWFHLWQSRREHHEAE